MQSSPHPSSALHSSSRIHRERAILYEKALTENMCALVGLQLISAAEEEINDLENTPSLLFRNSIKQRMTTVVQRIPNTALLMYSN